MDARVRRARRSDKDSLMSFIRHVWGGNDYIPYVWDDWLRDRAGEVYVVEADGRAVGMNRVRFADDGSAWFEGVRVHPDYRGRGLASMLGENSMKAAAKRGATLFRLTSGSRNRLAHRQIARMHFNEAARFSLYEPGEKPRPRRTGATKMKAGEEAEVLSLMRSAKEFRLGTGVYWHDFAAASLTPETVGKLVEGGRVWARGGAVAVAGKGGEGGRPWEEVSFVGGPPEDAARLVRALVGRVEGARERWVFVPQRSPIIRALRAAGFRRHFSMVLFERMAAKG